MKDTNNNNNGVNLSAVLGEFGEPPAPAKRTPAIGLTDKVSTEMRNLLNAQAEALGMRLDDYGKHLLWIGYKTVEARMNALNAPTTQG